MNESVDGRSELYLTSSDTLGEIYLDEPATGDRVISPSPPGNRLPGLDIDSPPNTDFHFLEPLDKPTVKVKQLMGIVLIGVDAGYSRELEKLAQSGKESSSKHGSIVNKLHLMDDLATSGHLRPRFDFGTLEAFSNYDRTGDYYDGLRRFHGLDDKQLLLVCNLPTRSFQGLFIKPITFFKQIAPVLRGTPKLADMFGLKMERLNAAGEHSPKGWGFYIWRVDRAE